MNAEAHAIVEELKKHSTDGGQPPTQRVASQVPAIGRLLILIAEETDRQTRRIIWLTWALLIFTAVLLAFTVAIYADAHAQIQHDRLEKNHDAKQP